MEFVKSARGFLPELVVQLREALRRRGQPDWQAIWFLFCILSRDSARESKLVWYDQRR